MVLLANKADIDGDPVPPDQIKSFCRANDISICKPTSAKTGEGVTEAFEELVQKLQKKSPKSK